ncbi:MAG TPA: hypothetical protein VH089_04890 [Streptosporangiaceae bacterium]|jgi:hypothetical protein|nr:hypothetical protein [Streptosporangiaceae bacterium]
MRKLKQYTIAGSAALAVALGGTGLAVAASAPGATQPAGDVHACVKPDGSVDFLQFRTENYGKCAAGDAAWTWARTDGAAPAPTTFGVGQVKVDSTTWAQYDAAELGAPGGDDTSGTVRFTCKNATDGCNVSLSAYSTGTGWTVYPRLVLEKEDNSTGAKLTCEYADGSTNEGGTTALTGTAKVVPLGVGSTFDCGSATQTGTAPDGVTSINVPGATGQGIHYDVFTTLTFIKAAS